MSNELKTEEFIHVSGARVVVYASIDGINGTIHYYGYVKAPLSHYPIFNEVVRKTKREVYQELEKCLSSYIQTMEALKTHCQQWGQET